jgi:hypothetical protein
VIFIFAVDDIHLYAEAIQPGVYDFLLRQLETNDLESSFCAQSNWQTKPGSAVLGGASNPVWSAPDCELAVSRRRTPPYRSSSTQ